VPDGWDLPEHVPGQFLSMGLFGSVPRCGLAEPETPPADSGKLIRRAYSIVSSPLNREFLEFYIALVPAGALTPRLFTLKIGDRVWLSQKPAGNFTFDAAGVPDDADVVLIATSSGLAPFVSMLSTYLMVTPKRRVAVIHGVRHSRDLGYRPILMAMEHLRTNVTYIPVVSRPAEEPVPWKGATGHVQDVWKSGAIEKSWGSRPRPENTHVFMVTKPGRSMRRLTGDEQPVQATAGLLRESRVMREWSPLRGRWIWPWS
jgi:ferredoxin/flavodoxin---NADP+ reductase